MRRMTQWKRTADLIVALPLAKLPEEHPDDAHAQRNYTREDASQVDFTGLPLRLNHSKRHAAVGQCVESRLKGDRVESVLTIEDGPDFAHDFSKRALANGYYDCVSLCHIYTEAASADGVPSVSKQAIEISLTSLGKRGGTVIENYFPCRATLEKLDDDALLKFAQTHYYVLQAKDALTPDGKRVANRARCLDALEQSVDQRMHKLFAERQFTQSLEYLRTGRYPTPRASACSGTWSLSCMPSINVVCAQFYD